jgi:hypothetical protein
MPVPVRFAVCGALLLLLTVRVADLEAVVAGVNFTLTTQVVLGATVVPEQVSEITAKSLGFVPPIVIVEMERSAVPVFVAVIGIV